MSSTKQTTRRSASRGFDTVVLKDLHCLQKWNIGHLRTYFKLGINSPSSGQNDSECDRLLCDETLDDLDNDIWATPVAKPKRAKKCRSGSNLPSPRSASAPSSPWSVTVPPNSPAEHRPVLPQTQSAVLPQSPVPPQSPVLSQRPVLSQSPVQPQQARSNPYISYLVQSLEGHRASPAHRQATPTASPVADPPVHQRHPEEPEDDLISVNPDDILVIPDSTREELTLLASQPRPARQWDEEEQCVPVFETTRRQPEQDELLFVDDGFLTPSSSQPTSCQADHIVPDIDFEE